MLNKFPKHLPSWWPKFIPRMKSDHCNGSEQMKATQTIATKQNNSACYVSSFMSSYSFFFFLITLFSFIFFNIFLSTRSTREWTTKCFTAIRCKILSIEKQVDAPIIERELAYSKTQSSRANLGIYFFQTKSIGHQRMEKIL